ncbi:glycosyltransferase family 2 protein [Marinobacter halotolerans]|uniref:glycosyltransferase family 2 protein n=1 Tax=Marinobacter halotolerans TaxID=1569211 RepID=UPI00177E1AD5|nr:glycosyltransferase family 2 protein [Marinobacter halotolerans]
MKNVINFLKTLLFFPFYIRKIHVIGLELQGKINSLEEIKKQNEKNLIYINTLNSSYLSKDHGLNKLEREKNITISLTSHSYRVDRVHLTIQSLMDQELKADRISLYLDDSDFDASNLPKDLINLTDRGLKISYKKPIGPYNKLIPALKEYPNDLIVTVDDDLIYPRSFLRKLYESYIRDPNFIHCYRMHYMKFGDNGKLARYKNWDLESGIIEPGLLVFPTGVGGVLYPPNSLNDEVFNEEAFLALAPGADDIWFKAMSLLNRVQCKKVESDIMNHKNVITIRDTQEIALHHENLRNDKNDLKIENVFNAYNTWEVLKKQIQ